jgi:hypothetical protein
MNEYLLKNDDFGYSSGATDAINKIASFISSREVEKLKNEKLQVKANTFRESQYLQFAAELTISVYFARNFTDTFRYEDKVNPPKDVDCSYIEKGIKFNIEVKCADYTKSKKINCSQGILLDSLGRYGDYYELKEKLGNILSSSETPLLLQQNMDNKLKDFLLSSHEKFICPSKNDHLNILIVCCDNAQDIQKWYSYMFEAQGLFTEHSFFDQESYNSVDVVVLSNVYHRHHNYKKKDKIINHWDFGSAFNLIFLNPFRLLEKEKAMKLLYNTIPSFTKDFFEYEGPIDSEGKVHSQIKMPYLIDEIEKREKTSYFQDI